MRKTILLFLSLLFFYSAPAQLTVQTGYTAQQLAEILAGPGFTVTNATLTGAAAAAGSFNGTTSNIGAGSGVILCSGDVNVAVGPNNQGGAGTDNGAPGIAELDAIAGVPTYNAVVLQFDFEVQTEFITFNYVFASEEYLEFVDQFNDVFAFWISGPGISGWENIALVPNTTVPVTINNINNQDYWQYYVDNGDGSTPFLNPTVQYDGFTTLIAAKKYGLIPCETYTLKLAIADASDGVYDTGVFLEENSLVQGTVDAQTNTINADSVALEGCIKASFTFSIDSVKSAPTVINYGIGGTAVNGVDYVFIDSTMIIPAGQTSAVIIINALADGIPESQESIKLFFEPFPCTPVDTVYLYINDADPINFSLSGTGLGCAGDSSGIIDGFISGGFPPYNITLNGTYAFDSLPIANLPADTYLVVIRDIYGCDAEAIVAGGVDSAGLTFIPDGDGNVYTTSIPITSFDPSATLTDISMLQSICVNMEHSFLGELEIKLIAPDSTEIILKEQPGGSNANFGEPVAKAPTDGNNPDTTAGICYQYCWTMNPTYGTMVSEVGNYNYTYTDAVGTVLSDKYLPSGSYQPYQPLSGLLGVPLNGDWTVWVMDNKPNDNGYICSWSISLNADRADSIIIVTEPDKILINDSITLPSCGSTTGTINISISGDYPPFTYNWSNGAATEDISNVGAGTYTVTVTDANGCSDSSAFLMPNISSIVLSEVVNQVTCNSLSNGAINLTVTGGTLPYTYSWDNGAVTEDISGLPAGNFTVIVTDGAGCLSLKTVTVPEPAIIAINALNILNEKCGEQNGAINIVVTGGTAPFSFTWSNGETTEDIDTIPAGSYSITVSDSKGCTAANTFTLINEVGNCVVYCYLYVSNILATDEICGNGAGAIAITISDGTQPFIYSWSNGATTEDVSGLSAGAYIIHVQDAMGCKDTDTISVNNNTGNLSITGTIVTNESCGNGQGKIDITVSGGIAPYVYLWSNGSTVEDATGLNAGTYSSTITDANSCIINIGATVENNAGTLVQTWGNVIDELCGNGQGSIDIIITGGSPPYTYLWTNGATTEDLQNRSAGTYTCTISDFTGCQITTPTYTIYNNAGTLTIFDIDIFNEICGDGAGSINLDITGGTTPYSFIWNTGATTKIISGKSAGTYSCSVTDADGCSVSTGDINLLNSSGDLSIDAIFVMDENCNNKQGYINITVSGSATPFLFSWTNNSTSEDISGLSAGTYSCLITDTNGCTFNTEATVGNTSGTLLVNNIAITDEICGNGQGSISLMISGGTSPLSYNWSNGSTSALLSGLNAGTYTCQITDSNGCSVNASATVFNDAGTLLLDNTIVTNEICGNSQGSIDITVSGGAIPYAYLWSNGGTQSLIANLQSATYSCQVTDNTGCIINTGSITIANSPGGLTIVSIVVTNESCGNAGGVINLTLSGGTVPYSYTWSNGAATQDISGLAAGAYTCLVTDATGCAVNATADLVNDAGTLIIDNIAITDEVCGNNAGAIDLSHSGGVAPYTYSWSNGASGGDISGLSAGTYSCTIIDANGCTLNTNGLNVVNSSGTLSLNNVFVNNESCGDSTGYVNITLSGGTPPYGFAWSNGAATEDVYGLTTGTYSCLAADNIGCTINLNANVLNDAGNLIITDSIITNEVCSDGMGAIDISVGGGTSPYTYNWSNGGTTQDISGIPAGVYTLAVADNGGCAANHSAVIKNIGENFSIATISVTDEICGNGLGAIAITVSGGAVPYSYLWSNGSTQSAIANLQSAIYYVTVTDTNSCTANATITVQNSSVNLTISNAVVTNDYCSAGTGSINITVSGGNPPYSYDWSTGATTQDISGLFAGNYSVTVTDWDGCGTNMNYSVVNNSTGFAITNTMVTDEICGDSTGAIAITVAGGTPPYTFVWSNGGTQSLIFNLQSAIYSVTVTDAFNCETTASAVVQDSSGTLLISNVNITDDNCGDSTGVVDIVVSGGAAPYTYLWNNGATQSAISNLQSAIYTVTVTDTNNCRTTANALIVNLAAGYAVNNAISTDEVCSNSSGSIDITVSGGTPPYGYVWSNGATSASLNGLNAGIYTVTVTDSNGCNTDSTLTVQNNPGTLSVTITGIIDDYCGDGNGSVDITVSGGTAPYYFNWNNGETTEDINGLIAGNYSLILSDANNCITGISATIVNIAIGYGISNVTLSNDFCGDGNGYIDIAVSAGTPPYTYLWSNSAATEDITGLSAGLYMVTVSDSYGCIKDTSATILNIAGNFMVSDTLVTNENCGNGQGTIDITISGGTPPYGFLWSNGAATEDISGLNAGSFTCTVTDNNSCTITAVINVFNQTGSLNIDTAIVTNENCGDGNGAIVITVSGGASPYTFAWSNGAVSASLNGLNAGIYSVTVTDALNCKITASATVQNNSGGLILSSSTVTDENCGNGQGVVDITVSGGTPPYTFSWSNSATTEDIFGLSAGNYSCTVTDDNGCILNISDTVVNQTGGFSLDTIVVTYEICGNGNGAIVITVSGGTSPYTYLWSNGGTQSVITNLQSAIYSVTVTDNNGCMFSEDVNLLNATGNFSVSNIIVTDEYCANGLGSINLTISGGILPYTYTWSNGDATQDITDLSAGNYTCTISDSSGCIINTGGNILNETKNYILDTVIVSDEICANAQGAIDVTVSGGFTPYTFSWSNSATTEDIAGLSAGNYTCIIADSAGCILNTGGTISNQTQGFNLDNAIVTDEMCSKAQGAIVITVSGGAIPYTYQWSNGATSASLSGLNAGIYAVTVTDLFGCIADTTVTVQNDQGTLNITGVAATDEVCGNGNGSIDITVSGGAIPYTYQWSNGATSASFSGLNAGIYTVTVSDNNGCSVTDTAVVKNPTGNPPQTSSITGLTSVGELSVENYSVSFNAGSIYYWSVTGGNQISGGQSNAISIYWGTTGTGLITVLEKNAAGCFGDTVYLTVKIGSTGINNQQSTNNNQLKVYPNPTNGFITLEIELPQETTVQVVIYNVFGEVAFVNSITTQKSKKEMDVRNLSDGIYMLKLKTEFFSINKRIVIAR